MLSAAVIGASGFTGLELIRLLSQHPKVKKLLVVTRYNNKHFSSDFFESISKIVDLDFTNLEALNSTNCDVVFFATPHGVAMKKTQYLLDLGIKVIDLSADFRLRNHNHFFKWYGIEHTNKEMLVESVYGLPELNRKKIKTSSLIAMPGCYPTAVILGFYPLLKSGIINSCNLIADCKSGVSGAGKSLKKENMFSEVSDNFKPYGMNGHRHWPEILQELQSVANGREKQDAHRDDIGLIFSPHLLPVMRGIQATLYCQLKESYTNFDVQGLFEKTYLSEPFVYIMSEGDCPETASVKGSNNVKISVRKTKKSINVDIDSLVIYVVIDNLVKGASGQAVQVMNIMFNMGEELGLSQIPLAV